MRHLRWAMVASTVVAILAGASLALRVAPAGAQAPAQAPPAQAGGPPVSRIAFVDVNRVLARSAVGAQAREALERERAAMQKEFDGKAEEIKRLGEELEKKGPLMTPDVRRDKQEQFERKRRDVSRLADDLARELEKKEGVLLQRVVLEIRGLVDKLGKERGYFMIVERQRAGVLYGAAEADLTDEVIKLYDAGAKVKK
ncbi:MAG: OmpH family outer membrane protein [Candidatus Rokuibacteriota bacterium]